MTKRIAHITDLHLDEAFTRDNGADARKNWERIIEDIVEKGITNVVFGGDIGSPDSNGWFFDQAMKKGINLKLVLGNHDLYSHAINYFQTGHNDREELYYSEDDDPDFRYIYLDTSLQAISQVQLEWLQQELKTPKKILLFLHHPVLQTGTTPQKEYPLKGSEAIKSALLDVKNEVYIFCGHLHLIDERTEANITQYVSPAASYQLSKQSETTQLDTIRFGYRIIELEKSGLTSEVILFDAE